MKQRTLLFVASIIVLMLITSVSYARNVLEWDDILYPGQYLEIGSSSFLSPKGHFRFYHQTDGNLVLYSYTPGLVSHEVLWSSNTYGISTTHLIMQRDGNLVLYSGSSAVWSSGTYNHCPYNHACSSKGEFAVLQGDGNFVIYDYFTKYKLNPLWSTDTWQG
jgi:hypothetical protein